IYFRALPQAEVQTRVLCRLITHAAFTLIIEGQVAGCEPYPRAHSIAVRLRSNQQNLQPVVRIASIVAKELRRLTAVADQNVQVAIVVKIADGRSPAHSRRQKSRPEMIAHVFENT